MVGGKPKIVARTPVFGRVVAVLTSKRDARALQLIHPWTRCIVQHEVHELLLTDEMDARPGGTVNRVAAVAFVEFGCSGLIMGSDKLRIGGREIGALIGFDETHCPNHINIVLGGSERRTGLELGLKGGDVMEFVMDQPAI
jgi:hypothetical protein